MKRAMLQLGLAAVVGDPLPQRSGWATGVERPKGGTGVTISGDYAKPNSDYGKGKHLGRSRVAGHRHDLPRQAWRGGSPGRPLRLHVIGGNAAFR